MNLGQKFELLESMARTISEDFREIMAPQVLDTEDRAYYDEASGVAEIMERVLTGNSTWAEAEAEFNRITGADE